MAGQILQLKVTLAGAKPPIWRRMLVQDSLTLAQLHTALQIAMGWMDCHLHEFVIGRQRFGPPGEEDCINEKKVRLAEVMPVAGLKMEYTYDFGDSWVHKLVVEKQFAPEPGAVYPICIDGKRACPPEDCGGPGGYDELLEALGNPEDEEHESMLEWVGGLFDPEAFSIDEVNQELKSLQRRLVKRSQPSTTAQH